MKPTLYECVRWWVVEWNFGLHLKYPWHCGHGYKFPKLYPYPHNPWVFLYPCLTLQLDNMCEDDQWIACESGLQWWQRENIPSWKLPFSIKVHWQKVKTYQLCVSYIFHPLLSLPLPSHFTAHSINYSWTTVVAVTASNTDKNANGKMHTNEGGQAGEWELAQGQANGWMGAGNLEIVRGISGEPYRLDVEVNFEENWCI